MAGQSLPLFNTSDDGGNTLMRRQSPYFFNAGLLYSGSLISRTAQAFAAILCHSRIPDFDVLFGPAYKGISLAAITAQTLYEKHGKDKAYCYNRKEKKDVSSQRCQPGVS